MDTGLYLREMRRQERRDALEELVVTSVKGLLLMEDGEELPLDQGYFDLGLTSLRLGELRAYLQEQLDLEIDATVLFSRPTVEQLVDHLTDALSVPQTDREACDVA